VVVAVAYFQQLMEQFRRSAACRIREALPDQPIWPANRGIGGGFTARADSPIDKAGSSP
jgi:hypothetical protein